MLVNAISGGFRNFLDLKKRNANLKVLISMGGWNEGSEKYSKVKYGFRVIKKKPFPMPILRRY